MSGILPTGTRKQRKGTRAGPQRRRRRRRRRGRERETGRENTGLVTGAQKRRKELPAAYTKTLQKHEPGTTQEQLQNKKRSSSPKTFQEPPRNKNRTPQKRLRQGELFFLWPFSGAKKGHFRARNPPRKTPDNQSKVHSDKSSEKKNLRQMEL